MKRMKKTIYEYTIEFEDKRDDGNTGFSFPCDENGKIKLDGLSDCAIANYNKCESHPEKFYKYVKTESIAVVYGTCDNCGAEISMNDNGHGEFVCPKCGRRYYTSGTPVNNIYMGK